MYKYLITASIFIGSIAFHQAVHARDIDQTNDSSVKFNVSSMPTKILIDKEGKIIGRFEVDDASLDDMLKKYSDTNPPQLFTNWCGGDR
jgi:hypothetical protein